MYMSFFVKYLSDKTFSDKKVKPETSADLEVGLRGLLTPLVGFFKILISVFLSDHLHVQKVSKVNSLLLSYLHSYWYIRCDDINLSNTHLPYQRY